VYYVMALTLYMQVSYREVLRCLLEGIKWLLGPEWEVKVAGKCRWRRKRVPVWRSRGSQVWGYALASGGRRNREEADCFLSQARLSSVLARGVR
jgi:hypothetical protein